MPNPRAYTSSSLSLSLAAAIALGAGCSSKRHDDGTPDVPAAASDGSDAPVSIGATQDEAPPAAGTRGPPRAFPLTPPDLGGFTFVDAFPKASVSCPSALVWPTAPGASPFVLERAGRILRLDADGQRTVLDISSSVAFVSESGALGMALHPRFGDGTGPDPYVFLWYNAASSPTNRQRLSRFTWRAAEQSFDPASEILLVEEEELHAEHNGGKIAFGPDGFLYFGNGDDTSSANHQRLDRAFFAGIFRIDVDQRGGTVSHAPQRQPEGGRSSGYFVPNDNPFAFVPGALEEFFALGLRNPFGFSFDRATGAMWVADVGETWREEIDLVVAGGNYGWPYREGEIVRSGDALRIGRPEGPEYVYSHAEMGDLTAVLGGYVYRGSELPELLGRYIYSDWPSGRVWALRSQKGARLRETLFDNARRLVPMAIAEDNRGEIYLLHLTGIAKLTRAPSAGAFPRWLSETILFEDVAALAPAAELVPYVIRSPLWSDGAVKRRWVVPPRGRQVDIGDDGGSSLPAGSMLVKHFELPPSAAPHGRSRRLETRVLVVGESTTYGVSYRWNAEGSDAELVREPADESILDDAGGPARTWHFPSLGQCWSCHREENRVLGFHPRQLDLSGPVRDVFDAAKLSTITRPLVAPSDADASLDERASAWLAANCSGCHHHGASYLGGEDTWEARAGFTPGERRLLDAPHHNTPMAKALGLTDAPLVDPGHPEHSLLLARVRSTDPDLRMPPLGRSTVDEEGARLLEQWIGSLGRP